MKEKLYKNGKIHPSPPLTDHSSLLPATILTLATALSAEDREVLAYLISWNRTTINNKPSGQRKMTVKSSNRSSGSRGDSVDADYYHSPVFECNCFQCYMNFWTRWDASPNRQLIHEIIESYEEGLFWENKNKSSTRRKKERGGKRVQDVKDSNFGEAKTVEDKVVGVVESVEVVMNSGGGGEDGVEDGSVRKIVSFIGEKIWGVWNRD